MSEPTAPNEYTPQDFEARELYRDDMQRRHDTPKPKQSERKKLRKIRDSKAMDMRFGGATYPEIAEELDYPSAHSAREAIERATNKKYDEASTALRIHEDANLEEASRFVMGVIKADKPLPGMENLEELLATADRRDVERAVESMLEEVGQDVDRRLRAVDRIINIGARKGKLWGYDAPTKQEISGDAGIINVMFDSGIAPNGGMNEPELIVEPEK